MYSIYDFQVQIK